MLCVFVLDMASGTASVSRQTSPRLPISSGLGLPAAPSSSSPFPKPSAFSSSPSSAVVMAAGGGGATGGRGGGTEGQWMESLEWTSFAEWLDRWCEELMYRLGSAAQGDARSQQQPPQILSPQPDLTSPSGQRKKRCAYCIVSPMYFIATLIFKTYAEICAVFLFN